jgi:hypothetical protein
MHVAAGLHYGVDATCGNKIDFRSEATAAKSAAKLTEKYGRDMEGYPCGFCNGWHVGRKLTDEEVARFSAT